MLQRMICSGFAAIVVLTGCSSKPTDEPAAPQPLAVPVATAPSATQSSVTVFVDPKTGEIRDPTAEELAEIARRQQAKQNLPAPTQKPAKEIHLPDGTVAVEMDPSMDEPLKACHDKYGNVIASHDCAATVKDNPK